MLLVGESVGKVLRSFEKKKYSAYEWVGMAREEFAEILGQKGEWEANKSVPSLGRGRKILL